MIFLLLDVDGVLNASKAGWKRAPKRSYAHAEGMAWIMRWEPQVMLKLHALHNDRSVTILWATTWVGNTDALETLFGLPHFESAADSSMNIGDKQAAAEALIDMGHDVIWIDDEAIPLDGPLFDKLVEADALTIRPHPGRGLRPEHFDEIDDYVARKLTTTLPVS
jgi:hypothetical protein